MGDALKKINFKPSPGLSSLKRSLAQHYCHVSHQWRSPRTREDGFPSLWGLRKHGSIWEALRNIPYLGWSLHHMLLGAAQLLPLWWGNWEQTLFCYRTFSGSYGPQVLL